MAGKEKKKSSFSLDKYKTHNGEFGNPDTWIDTMRQALMLEDPKATREEIETKLKDKLTKTGARKIQID